MSLKTRKGLDWTAKFRAIAEEAASLPDSIIDGEIVALDENGAPNFAALQAALSEQNTDDLVFYVFDLLFEGADDLRALALAERKDRLRKVLSARKAAESRAHPLRRAFRDGRRRRAAFRVQALTRGHRLEASGCALPLRPDG